MLRTPRLRAALVAAGCLALNAGCWAWCAEDRRALLQPGSDLTLLVTAIAAWLLQAGLAWLLVLVVLAALEPWAGRELTTYAGCPGWLRSGVLAAFGVAALGAWAAPAQASPSPGVLGETHVPAGTTSGAVLDGLPLPSRPEDTSAQASKPGDAAGRERTVVVLPGDSLWLISARLLPPTAGDSDVARTCHRIYTANRERIGEDPDLILPGTRLSIPTTAHHHQEER